MRRKFSARIEIKQKVIGAIEVDGVMAVTQVTNKVKDLVSKSPELVSVVLIVTMYEPVLLKVFV